MKSPNTRIATMADVGAIAAVHEAAFKGYFLARMGHAFLCAYYRLVIEYAGGILIVCEEDSEISGFVAGFADPAGFYAHMSRERSNLYGPTFAAVIRRPALLTQVLANRRRVTSDNHPSGPGCCELSSIAVLPGSVGRGHGKILIDDFCAAAAERGCKRIILTTDALNNDVVNAFYVRCGFMLIRTFIAGGKRTMNEYERLLPDGFVSEADRMD